VSGMMEEIRRGKPRAALLRRLVIELPTAMGADKVRLQPHVFLLRSSSARARAIASRSEGMSA